MSDEKRYRGQGFGRVGLRRPTTREPGGFTLPQNGSASCLAGLCEPEDLRAGTEGLRPAVRVLEVAVSGLDACRVVLAQVGPDVRKVRLTGAHDDQVQEAGFRPDKPRTDYHPDGSGKALPESPISPGRVSCTESTGATGARSGRGRCAITSPDGALSTHSVSLAVLTTPAAVSR